MPLTTAQENLIKDAIIYFIDLPNEKPHLIAEVNQLKKIFSPNIRSSDEKKSIEEKEIKESHDDELLKKCVFQPTHYFLNLEKLNHGGMITIGDVQKTIFDFITAEIQKAADRVKIDFNKLSWTDDLFKPFLENKDYTKPFVSIKLRVSTAENPSPYDLKPKNKIFSGKFRPHNGYVLALMSNKELKEGVIEFKCQPNGFSYRVIGLDQSEKNGLIPWDLLLPTGFPNDDKQVLRNKNILLFEVLNHTSKEHHTVPDNQFGIIIKFTINFPNSDQPVSRSVFMSYTELFKKVDHASQQEIQQSIAERLWNCEIESAQCATIILSIVENEVSKSVINNLIKNKIIAKAKPLSDGAKKLITDINYYECLYSKQVNLQDIAAITIEEAEMLCNEAIIHLIKNNHCALSFAKTLSQSALTLISTPLYASWINQKKISIETLNTLSKTQKAHLILPPMIHLLTLEKISFDQACQASPLSVKIISDEFYFNLLIQNLFTYSDIEKITQSQFDRLQSDLRIKLISKKVISVKEAMIVSRHVVSILNCNPFISFLVKEGIMETCDVSKILHCTTSQTTSMQFNKSQINPWLVDQLLSLANIGLLFDRDFEELMINTEETKSINMNHPYIHLVPIYNRCRANAIMRMTYIISNNPFTLQDGDDDTLLTLKNHWKQIDCHFNLIRDEVLQNAIQLYHQNQPNQLYYLTKYATQINLTPFIIWGKTFSVPLLRLFEQYDAHHGNLNRPFLYHIETDFQRIADEYQLSIEELRRVTSTFLLPMIAKEQVSHFKIQQQYKRFKFFASNQAQIDKAKVKQFFNDINSALNEIEQRQLAQFAFR